MIIVTGAAGFIGANIIAGLNKMGHTDILAVDDLSDGKKYLNLVDYDIADYMDMDDFIGHILSDDEFADKVEAIFHEGACSETTEWDGRYMMENNYEYSKQVLHYALKHKIPFLYASSAAVYGGEQRFNTEDKKQHPLNVYGYSKWLFDQYVLRLMPKAESQIIGLRYFNVYGPHENHKDKMASVAFHLTNQLVNNGKVKLFEGYDGYADGAQQRDFVFVEDVVKVNLWFWQHPEISGIFNCGTGKAREFNDIAKTLIKLHGSGELEYIPFPDHLKSCYQSFTEADISGLRKAGYDAAFTSLEDGLEKYYRWLTTILPTEIK